jgi:hypothetical protein
MLKMIPGEPGGTCSYRAENIKDLAELARVMMPGEIRVDYRNGSALSIDTDAIGLELAGMGFPVIVSKRFVNDHTIALRKLQYYF